MGGNMPEHLIKTDALHDLDVFLNTSAPNELEKLLNELQTDPENEAVVLSRYPILRDREIPPDDVEALKVTFRTREIDAGILHTDQQGQQQDQQQGQQNPTWRFNEPLHMQEEWFTPQGEGKGLGWWQAAAGPIEPIMRRALIETIKLKLLIGKPVDSYWLCAGGDGNPAEDPASPGVHCFIAWSKDQITLLILTPEEPAGKMHHMHNPPYGQMRDDVDQGAINASGSGIIVVKPQEADPARREVVRPTWNSMIANVYETRPPERANAAGAAPA